MGLLTCECDHGRNVHLGAEEYDLDKKVFKCLHENCTCKHYRPDEKSRKLRNDVYLRVAFLPTIFGVIIILGAVALHAGFSAVLDQYEITAPIVTKTFYANGTEIPELSTVQSSDTILFVFDAMIGSSFFIGWYVGTVAYCDSAISKRMKELKSL